MEIQDVFKIAAAALRRSHAVQEYYFRYGNTPPTRDQEMFNDMIEDIIKTQSELVNKEINKILGNNV